MHQNGRTKLQEKTKKHVKWYVLLSFTRDASNKYRKQIIDTAIKTGEDALKTTIQYNLVFFQY